MNSDRCVALVVPGLSRPSTIMATPPGPFGHGREWWGVLAFEILYTPVGS